MKSENKKHSILAKIFIYTFLLGFILLLYSHFIGTKGLIIREYPIINNKIPDNFNGAKIVHFSDLHYGTTIHKKEMENIVKSINELKPDIVVFTGDLLDENVFLNDNQVNDLISSLNSINSTINKYIISGNHDINARYQEILGKINFKNLDNSNDLIYYKGNEPLLIVGLADSLKFNSKPEKAFYIPENDYYTILLTHEPDDIDKLIDYNFDLVLAGHSHNGQVRIPLIGKVYTPIGSKKYYDAKYDLNDAELYISGGLGTSMMPFRFLVKPSFNFYRLYNN